MVHVIETVILIILSVILPPLPVFIKVGCHSYFWISVLLTLLAWIPGVIYAIWVVITTPHQHHVK